MAQQIVSFVASIYNGITDIFNWLRKKSQHPVFQWVCITFGFLLGTIGSLSDMQLYPKSFPSLQFKSLYLIKCTTVTTYLTYIPFTTLSIGPFVFWTALVNLVRKDVGSFRIENGF